MYIKEINEQQFNDFAAKYDASSLYQTVEYAYTMQNQKFDIMFLGFVHNDEVLGATIILIEKILGFKYAYAPRGFLINYKSIIITENFTKEIKKYLSKLDIMAVKINPLIVRSIYDPKTKTSEFNKDQDLILDRLEKLGYFHLGYNDLFEALKPRFESILDISIPYNEIFTNFKKELKHKIRSAENHGLKVIKSNDSNLEYLYLQTKKKYPRDLEYFKDMYSFFNKKSEIDFFYIKMDTKEHLDKVRKLYEEYDNLSADIEQKILTNAKGKEKLISQKIEIDAKLFQYKQEIIKATKILGKNPNGVILASALFIKHKDSVNLIMDGYDTEYKNLNAKHLLLWRTIEYYNKLGFKKYNFGGMTNINDNNKFTGLNQFKMSFNAKVYEYMGDLELVTNQTSYFMYRHSRPLTSILKK
jgi:lipid II:glycine glycyltransferase (peptidoglycan interpeptide bridge formation enzyme)